MSVVVVATIHPKPGQLDAVQSVFEEAIPGVHQEDGCEFYALQRDSEQLVMIEKWASAEALAVHSRGANLRALGRRIADLTTGPAKILTLEAVPVGEPGKGAL